MKRINFKSSDLIVVTIFFIFFGIGDARGIQMSSRDDFLSNQADTRLIELRDFLVTSNAPQGRNEQKWLPGWQKRVGSYLGQ